MKSILYPNERSGVGCIGALECIVPCDWQSPDVACAEKSGFPQDATAAANSNEAFHQYFAERYNIPNCLVSTLCSSSLSAASIHATFVTMMTLGFIKMNNETEPPITMIDGNLDCLDGIVEASCFQCPIADLNGHSEGWSPSIDKDCARFVATRLAHHQPAPQHHHHEPDCPAPTAPRGRENHLYFVDLGPSATNAAVQAALPSAADRDAYDRYRLAALVVVSLIQKSESQKDFVHVVTTADLATSACGNIISKLDGGDRVVHLHKMCSWAHVFAIAKKDRLVQELLVDSQVRGHVNVHPPLFTHVTASPRFLRDARVALEAKRAQLDQESEACELLLEALRIWPSLSTIDAVESHNECAALEKMIGQSQKDVG